MEVVNNDNSNSSLLPIHLKYIWAILNLLATIIGIRAYVAWSDPSSNNTNLKGNIQASKLQVRDVK